MPESRPPIVFQVLGWIAPSASIPKAASWRRKRLVSSDAATQGSGRSFAKNRNPFCVLSIFVRSFFRTVQLTRPGTKRPEENVNVSSPTSTHAKGQPTTVGKAQGSGL